MHSLLWSALFLGLLVFSVVAIKDQLQIQTAPLSPADPLRSMNYYLMGPNHAQRLFAMMLGLPEDRSVLIFVRGTPGSIFHGVALDYLAWPRPVEMVFGNEKVVEEHLRGIRPDSVAAVAFCDVKSPPWFAAGVLCGPGVRLVCFGGTGSRQ